MFSNTRRRLGGPSGAVRQLCTGMLCSIVGASIDALAVGRNRLGKRLPENGKREGILNPLIETQLQGTRHRPITIQRIG